MSEFTERRRTFHEPLTDKEIVIYRRGNSFGFHLPDQHKVLISEEHQLVLLGIPDRGAIYYLDRIEETAEELHVHVGTSTVGGYGSPADYSFPTIDVELLRLRTLWKNAGLRETDFNAWAQGASHDSHTTEIRRRLREARRSDA